MIEEGVVVHGGSKSGRGASRWTGPLPMLVILVLALVAGMSGCIRKPRHVVPEYPTAREQADVANDQYRRARGTFDEKAQKEEREKALAALEAVVERFPDDRVYTPAAMVTMGDVLGDMGDHSRAESAYRRAIREYSDIEDVHVYALFGLADSLGRQERFREEKEYYTQIIQTYGQSENQAVLQRVELAKRRLRQVK